MKIIKTDEPLTTTDSTELLHIYNGLDCMLTAEILDALLPQLDDHTSGTYDFSRALQGPALEMRLRGVRIDKARKEEVIDEYFDTLDRLEENLHRLVGEACDFWQFNWKSHKDKKELFYDRLGIPVIKKGGKPTTDRPALEKMEVYIVAKPIVRHLMAMDDIRMKVQMLQTGIDPDGRIRTSYNIGGTSTGRFSSSMSEFGTGTNLQNIEESLRSVFIADPGMKLAYLDAQQGESRVVGAIEYNLFRDSTYLDACEGGDLHTNVAKLVWPELEWTGNAEDDRALAERPYYRHYDRRFMCKKIGHGSNYRGQPRTLATQAKVDVNLIIDFQPKYFTAFPAHLEWHRHVQSVLQSCGFIVSLTGRKRYFHGRRGDDSTLREAIAYDPQGSLADILNGGMLNVWRQRDCVLLMQIHDAILIQYPEKQEDEIIPKVLFQLKRPIELKHGRTLTIPYDAMTGWNWGKYKEGSNPDGLKTYKGGDTRKRTPQMSVLDRPLRRMDKANRIA